MYEGVCDGGEAAGTWHLPSVPSASQLASQPVRVCARTAGGWQAARTRLCRVTAGDGDSNAAPTRNARAPIATVLPCIGSCGQPPPPPPPRGK